MIRRCLLLLLLMCLSVRMWGREASDSLVRVVWYNCENAFDTYHDSLKNDYDFTPNGAYKWTVGKYKKKMEHIAKALIAAGGWSKPVLIGLCEIENKRVLSDLTKRTTLAGYGYRYVHQESEDERGVDVALLYDAEKVRIVEKEFLRVRIEEKPTRDILRAKCVVGNNDTIHIFVNHWPSKYGGAKESEPRRKAMAQTLRNATDSILTRNADANIVIMGDMNEGVDEYAVCEVLGASLGDDVDARSGLMNLTAKYKGEVRVGTHFFSGAWDVLDQVIVSRGMADSTSNTYTSKSRLEICAEDMLMERTKKGVLKPYRSFRGTYYAGGFSDHLPVWFDIVIKGQR